MDQHIIYRNRGEAFWDDFWWNTATPWVGEHWWGVAGFLVAFVAVVLILPPILEKRRWRRRKW
jgi:hypothetical protein